MIDFLIQNGMVRDENGRLMVRPNGMHLEKSSPLVHRHHANWRIRALARHETMGPNEMAYTCPVSINKRHQPVIREMLLQLIEKFLEKVKEGETADTLACLNIDWFKFA
jgi:hypothetical protein